MKSGCIYFTAVTGHVPLSGHLAQLFATPVGTLRPYLEITAAVLRANETVFFALVSRNCHGHR